jgi:hypothetical protein
MAAPHQDEVLRICHTAYLLASRREEKNWPSPDA